MDVERIAAPSRAHFEREYVSKRKPVIITGVVDQWRATSQWNLEYFRSLIGDKKVPVRCFPTNDIGDWQTSTTKRVRVDNFLDYLEQPDRDQQPYLEFVSLQADLPELARDIRRPIYFDEKQLFNVVLFLGRDTLAPLHYHPVEENFLCQISGRKRVLLYPPEQSALLYPIEWDTERAPSFSKVRVENPDFGKFPRFRDARPLECFLEPGEMLFIPLHWWHVVYGYGLGVSVAWFWKPKLAQQRYWFTSSLGRRYIANRMLKSIVKSRFAGVVRPNRDQVNAAKFDADK